MTFEQFMSKVYEWLFEQLRKQGFSVALLLIALYIGWQKFEQQSEKNETLQTGLTMCETERAKLTERVDFMGREIISLKAAVQISNAGKRR